MSTSRAARSLLVLPARSAVTPVCSRPVSRALCQPTKNRCLSTSIAVSAEDRPKNKGLFSSLLHGSDSAKEDGLTATAQSHSQQVGRGKYIHEIQRHVVRPDEVRDYIKLLAEYYPKLASDKEFPCRLIGSWQVSVGELETFCESFPLSLLIRDRKEAPTPFPTDHIWEYDGYNGYDACDAALQTSEVITTHDIAHLRMVVLIFPLLLLTGLWQLHLQSPQDFSLSIKLAHPGVCLLEDCSCSQKCGT
jgi:hypothetical protein